MITGGFLTAVAVVAFVWAGFHAGLILLTGVTLIALF